MDLESLRIARWFFIAASSRKEVWRRKHGGVSLKMKRRCGKGIVGIFHTPNLKRFT
jgi:hypothetical protein